jgi:hypothetical protein
MLRLVWGCVYGTLHLGVGLLVGYNVGVCWHHFFWKKTGQKGIRRSSRWESSTIGRLKKRGWSTEPADGQGGLTLSIDGLAGQTNLPIVNRGNRPMEKKKAVIKEIHQRQGTTEAGRSIGNGSESVLGQFDSRMCLFLLLVVFVFFRCK